MRACAGRAQPEQKRFARATLAKVCAESPRRRRFRGGELKEPAADCDFAMAKTTTNKSLRLDAPRKEVRRRAVAEGESPEPGLNRAAGATGVPAHARKRPGRAASLRGTAQRMRSQKWRHPEEGPVARRRGNLAKGSRTGRNRVKL